MKRNILLLIASLMVAMPFDSFAQGYEDDLYISPRAERAARAQREQELEQELVQMRAQKAERDRKNQLLISGISQSSTSAAGSISSGANAVEQDELVTSYEAALRRRIAAYSDTVERNEGYWALMDDYRTMLARKYDMNLYNIIEFNNLIWVEPQDITAMFDGSDPLDGVRKFTQSTKAKAQSRSSQSSASGSSLLSDGVVNVNYITISPYVGYGGYGRYGGWGGWGGNPYFGFGASSWAGFGFNIGFGWGGSPYYAPYASFYDPFFYDPFFYRPYWGGWNNWYYPYHGYHGHHLPSWGPPSGEGRPVIVGGDRRGSYNPGAPSLRPGAPRPDASSYGNGSNFRRGNNGTNNIVGRPGTSARPSNNSEFGSGTRRQESTVQYKPRPTFREESERENTYQRPERETYRPSPSPASSPSYRPSPSPGGSGGGFSTGRRR